MINTPKTLNDYKVYIESYIGNMFDITQQVTSIELIESIENYSISGSVRFLDNSALMTIIPIIGMERVHIILNKDIPDSTVDVLTTIIMRVTNITSVNQEIESSASITLSLVDEKSTINDTLMFSRSMSGLDTEILRKIYEDYIQPINNIPLNIISKGVTNRTIVWPHMTPYQAFDTVLKYATDSYNTPLFLFDTLWTEKSIDRRTKLISYRDMMSQRPIEINNGVINNTNNKNDIAELVESASKQAYDITPLKNLYKSSALIRNGAFANLNTSFDISRKTISEMKFNAMKHAPSIAKNVWSDRAMYDDLSVYDRADTVINTFIENSIAFDAGMDPSLVNHDITQYNANKSYSQRLAGTYGVNIKMDSDTNVRAGSTITIDVEKFAPVLNATDEMKDYLQSGKFIVKEVVHNIKYSEYTMNVVAIRDGMGEEGKL